MYKRQVLRWTGLLSTGYFWIQNIVNGVLIVLINTPINTFMQQVIPHHLQGRVFSLDGTISQMLAPLGTLMFGVLFDHLAAPLLFGVTGIVLIIFTLIVTGLIRRSHLYDKPENQVPAAAN